MPPRARPRRPVMPTARTQQVPAPVGGLNTAAGGFALPPSDCAQVYNLIASESGLRVRLGEQEWCTGLTGDSDDTVRSVLAFKGAASTKLWAATNTGLWDVTDTSATPTQVVAFPTSTGNAGYGVTASVVTSAGHYFLYADEMNGLYRYAETGATWTKVAFGGGAGEIGGVNPGAVVFVMAFKGRVWLVSRDTASAWYLPAGSIAGTASEFPMGMAFKRGGSLLGLWSWTYDGGAGMDDSLVALSTGGDVVIYQGTDPASAATFALRGVWYMGGPPPAGRQAATSDGGELQLLTRQGVLPLSRLVVGGDESQATTLKIANLINALMGQRGNSRGWAMIQHPEDAAFVVVVPRGTSDYAMQLAQANATKGWFPWRGLDMASVVAWEGLLYYGTTDGRVCMNSGYVDGVTLAEPGAFTAIDWNLLTATTDLGAPVQKQVGLIRPLFLSEGRAPSFSADARYGYSQTELDSVTLEAGVGTLWDDATWDESLWGGGSEPTQVTRGVTGMGTEVAIAIRGVASSKTTLVGFAITYTAGNSFL